MLKLNEVFPVCLPNYHMTIRLSKDEILKRCVSDVDLMAYFPNSSNLEVIERNFLLSVLEVLN
jgi:hypothetical protein